MFFLPFSSVVGVFDMERRLAFPFPSIFLLFISSVIFLGLTETRVCLSASQLCWIERRQV